MNVALYSKASASDLLECAHAGPGAAGESGNGLQGVEGASATAALGEDVNCG